MPLLSSQSLSQLSHFRRIKILHSLWSDFNSSKVYPCPSLPQHVINAAPSYIGVTAACKSMQTQVFHRMLRVPQQQRLSLTQGYTSQGLALRSAHNKARRDSINKLNLRQQKLLNHFCPLVPLVGYREKLKSCNKYIIYGNSEIMIMLAELKLRT